MLSRATPIRPRRRLPALRSSFRILRLEDRLTPAVIAWDGGPAGTGTEWTDPVNWAGDTLPGSADEAQIGAAFSSTAVVHSSGATSVQKVASEAAVTITGGSFAMASGTSSFAKGLTVANGAAIVLQNTALASTLDLQGTLTARGSVAAVGGPLTTAATSVIRVQGDGNFSNAALTVASGFTNLGAIELTSVNGSIEAALNVTAGTLVNAAGALIKSLAGTGGNRVLNAELDNKGSLTIDRSLAMSRGGSKHVNTGVIDVNANLVVNQTGTTPSFTQAGGSLTLAPGTTLSVGGGAFNFTAGALGGPGTLNFASVTANFTPDFSNAVTALVLSSSTYNGPGTLTNAGALTLTNSTVNAPLVNQGTLTARGSTAAVGGPLTTTATSVIRVQGDGFFSVGSLTVASGFTNLGAVELTAVNGSIEATLNVTAGSLVNAPGAAVKSLAGTGGNRNLNAELNNKGTVTVDQSLAMSRAGSKHVNTGAVDLNANLVVNQTGTTPSFTHAGGSITLASGVTLAVGGGAFDFTGGSLGGPGTLNFASVTANFTPDFSNAVTALVLSNSTFNGPGTLTNAGALTLTNSTVNAPLVNQGTLTARGSTAAVGGPLTTTATSVIRVQGDGFFSVGSLTVASGFTNLGAVELTAVNGSIEATLKVTAGTLVNAPGASVKSLAGTGGNRNLNAELDNKGTLTVDQSLVIGRSSSKHVNTGAIDLNATLVVNQTGTTPSFTHAGGSISLAPGTTLSVGSGAFNFTAGALGGPGTLLFSNLTANFTPDFSNAVTALVLSSSTYNGPGTLTNAGALTLTNSTVNAPLVNQGTLTARGSTAAVGGPLTTTATSVIRVQGDGFFSVGSLTVASGFTNLGAVELTAVNGSIEATLNVTAGTLVNAPGASIKSLAGTGGNRVLNAELDNKGTLTVDQSLAMSRAGSKHVNTGAIDLNANLVVNQTGTTPSFTHAGGSITLPPGTTLSVGGGAFNFTSGALGGPGTLNFASVTASFTPDFTNAVTALVLSNSTLNGPGTLTNANKLTLTNSTINAPLVNQGTLTARGSTPAVGGPLTTTPTSLIRVQGDGNFSVATLTVANGFTNQGSVELTSVNGAIGATLNVSAGTMTNAPGASVKALLGTAGPRQISAKIDNQGTVQVEAVTLNVSQALTNFSATTLTGGSYLITGTLRFPGADVVTNAAAITLDGPAAGIRNLTNNANALTNLAAITAAGSLTLQAKHDFSTAGVLTTAGAIVVKAGSSLNLAAKALNQSGGTTTMDGTLTAAAVNLTGGTLTGAGTVKAAVVNSGGIVLSGSGTLTIDGDYSQSDTGKATIPVGTSLVTINGGKFDQAGGTTTVDGTLDPAGTIVLAGGTLTGVGLVKASITNTGAVVEPGSGTLTLDGDYTQSGTALVDVPINRALVTINAGTFSQAGGTATVDGTLDPAGNLALSGGTLGGGGVIAADVINTGGTLQPSGIQLTVDGHYVQQSGQAVIPTGKSLVTISGGKFEQSGGTATVDGTLDPAGDVTLTGGSLTGSGVIKANVANSGGSFQPGPGALTVDGNYVQSGTGQTNVVAARSLVVSGVVIQSGGSLLVDGSFEAAAGMTLSGGTLSGSGTVKAAVINSGGSLGPSASAKLTLDGNYSQSGAGLVNVPAGSTLAGVNGGKIEQAGGTITADGLLDPAADLLLTGGTLTGAGTVRANVVNTGGTVQPGVGTLIIDGNYSQSAAGQVVIPTGRALTTVNGGQFAQSGGTVTADGTLDPASDVSLSGGTLTGVGTIQASVVNTGGTLQPGLGTLTLEGNVSQSAGQTTIPAGGSLVLINAGTFAQTGGSTTVDGVLDPAAAVVVNGGAMSGTGTVRANIHNNGGTVQPGSGTLTVDGHFTQSGTGQTLVPPTRTLLVINGTFSPSAGTTTVDGILDSAGGVAMTGGTLSGLGNVKAAVTNSGGLVQPGAGTLTITGTYTPSAAGQTTVAASTTLVISGDLNQAGGTTRVDGTLSAPAVNLGGGEIQGAGVVNAAVVNAGAVVSPGASPGTLTINGSYTQQAGGGHAVELNGTSAGITHDRLVVNGAVTLGGALSATLGYLPTVGDSYTFIDNDGADPITGAFAGIADQSTITLNGIRFRMNYAGGDGNDVSLTRLATGIDAVILDDGTAQRSRIRSLTVNFGGVVTLPAIPSDAFVLTRAGAGAVAVSVDTSASTPAATIAKLTFSGAFTSGGSLIDGDYSLTVLGAQVTDPAGALLDGDGDGVAGGDTARLFHRLFGDADGDRDVDARDFGAFRHGFATANLAFDADGDGVVNAADFTAFRNQFGTFLP